MKIRNISFVAALASAAFALAHGPTIQVANTNGRITTYEMAYDESTSTYGQGYGTYTTPTYAYMIPLTQRNYTDSSSTLNGWYGNINTTNSNAQYLGPGISYKANGTTSNGLAGFDTGVTITETIVSGLSVWNGSSFVDAGGEQLQGLPGSTLGTAVASLSTATGAGKTFSLTTKSSGHSQLFWRLADASGNPAGTIDDGVYMAMFQLSTSQAGVANSYTYAMLFSKNASSTDQSAALAYANTVVPEPASLGALAIGGVALLRRRRRD